MPSSTYKTPSSVILGKGENMPVMVIQIRKDKKIIVHTDPHGEKIFSKRNNFSLTSTTLEIL